MPEDGLFTRCRGGTEIAVALSRGLEIVRTHPGALNKADVVLITDGGSDATSAPQLREQAAQLGVTIFGVGIGVAPSCLEPWCDEIHAVWNLSTVEEDIATPLFAA